MVKTTFLVKRLVINSINSKGNGTIEEVLKFKHPYMLRTKTGSSEELCAEMRQLFYRMITSKDSNAKVLLPEGTRMVHLRSNADKKRTVSCMVIFKEDVKYDDRPAVGDEGESDWDFSDDVHPGI